MSETFTVTDFRTRIGEVMSRVMQGESITITSQGRPAARLVPPSRPSSTAWVATGSHPRDHLPDRIRAVHPEKNRGMTRLWIYAATGAVVALVPGANWDAAGAPQVYYFAPHGGEPVRIESWSILMSWDGNSSTDYGRAMDNAEALVADRLAELL